MSRPRSKSEDPISLSIRPQYTQISQASEDPFSTADGLSVITSHLLQERPQSKLADVPTRTNIGTGTTVVYRYRYRYRYSEYSNNPLTLQSHDRQINQGERDQISHPWTRRPICTCRDP